MATTHKRMMKMIEEFLEYSKKYREKKEKKTLKDDAMWLQKYNDLQKVINDYDINKIDYSKGTNV